MSATTEKTTEKMTLVPTRALIAGIVLLAVGVTIGLTRESRARAYAVGVLNGAEVRLIAQADNKPIADGYEAYYGHVVLMNNHRAYEELLGHCTTRPDRAAEILREVLKSGTWQGKTLACHMAFYLAQENSLTREDVEEMVGLLSNPNEELRRVAQRELGLLLVVRKTDKKAAYEDMGTAPAGLTGRFGAKTGDVEMPVPVKKDEWVRMWWTCPEACLACWKAFGAKVKWNPTIRRFAIDE